MTTPLPAPFQRGQIVRLPTERHILGRVTYAPCFDTPELADPRMARVWVQRGTDSAPRSYTAWEIAEAQ